MNKWKTVYLEDVCDILDNQRVPVTSKDRKKGVYPYYGANGIQDYVDDYIFDNELVLLAEDGGNFGSKDKPIAYRVSGKCWVNNHAHVLKARESIDVDYLCYSLMFYDVSSLVNGATRQKLNQAVMKKMTIPLPILEKQLEIVTRLNKVTHTIDLCNQLIEKLDLLVKAKFVEMFGEIGADKFGWGLDKMGDISEINPKKAKDNRLNSDLEVSFIPMTAVSEKGEIDVSEIRKYDEVKTGFTYFAENDILFAKITPCMENGKGCIAHNLYNGIGFGSTEFHVLRPLERINPYWLYTVTIFEQFRKNAFANMTGSAGQRRVPARFLENFKISIPPIELQNQFADFVKQTEKSKSAVKQVLEKAETLKKALMQEYFG